MNFTTSILAAGMLGFKAYAARDAFAAHRMALETILEPNQYHEVPVHHESRRYEHEYAYPVEHTVYHDAPSHDAYDAFDHDYKTEKAEHISYRHHGDDEFHGEFEESCGVKDYCHRFSQLLARDHHEYTGRQHHEHHRGQEDHYENGLQSNHLMTAYYVEPDSLVIHEDAIHATLHLHDHEYFANGMEFRAAHLDLHMALFQEGIMQVKIKASDEEERFSISNTGIGIDWDQIKVQQHMQDFVKILDDGILVSGQDKVSYKIQFDPFRIIQYVDGHETIIVNDNDNLYYDAKDLGIHHGAMHNDAAPHHAQPVHEKVAPHAAVPETHHEKPAAAKKPASSVVQGYSVGMDFTVNANHMYGIPQRADNFRLEETGFDHPYRLFN